MKIISEEKLFFWAFVCNLLIFLLEIVGLVIAAHEVGVGLFFYYTELSNILLLISSGSALFTFYANVVKGCGTNFPTHLLRFASTSANTLTFVVVLFVLMPTSSNPLSLLISGSMLFHHTLCPLLSLVSFLFFEKEEACHLKYSHVPLTLIFTVLYGLVFLLLNVFRVYDGPYFFLKVYDRPAWATVLWLVGILAFSYGIDFLLCLGNKKIFDRGVIHG